MFDTNELPQMVSRLRQIAANARIAAGGEDGRAVDGPAAEELLARAAAMERLAGTVADLYAKEMRRTTDKDS